MASKGTIGIFAALPLLALLACGPGPQGPNVLLLTLDTTRVDALSCYGGPLAKTPRLDALARESLRFTQAVTTAPYTGPSHASMLTGLLPPQHGLRDFLGTALPEQAQTLAEILSEAGYDTAAFVSAYVLHPRYALDQGFDVYSCVKAPKREGGYPQRRADQTADEALRWLRERRSERPFFVWLHFYDPHRLYRPPREYWPSLKHLPRKSPERKRLLYYAEATYMDAVIGRVLDAFEERGLLQDLTILAVSDHGELLGEHGRVPGTHSSMLVEQTLLVPLLLRAPGRVEPGVTNRQVSVVDVFPTILELVGLPLPKGIAGISLLRPGEGQRMVYSETLYEDFPHLARPGEELASVRIDGWKLVARPGREELYDLNADPSEERNVAAAHPHRLAQLRAALEALRASQPRDVRPRELDLSEEEEREHIEHLRSLGYVE
jgi:arylsulfatase A-like enzyme